MGERHQALRSQAMATTSTAVATVAQPLQEEPVERMAVITLRQTAPPAARTECRRKVVWAEDTVDNENMDKKKSKCCCIYQKPRKFGESDSESSDDDDCEHCLKHVEKKRIKIQTKPAAAPADTQVSGPAQQEPGVSLPLQPPEPTPEPDAAPPH